MSQFDSTSATTIAYEPVSLFNTLHAIESNPNVDSSVKSAMKDLKETIFFKHMNLFPKEEFAQVSRTTLFSKFEEWIGKLNFENVQRILVSGIFNPTEPCCENIIFKLPGSLSGVTDERIAEMLELLLRYGFAPNNDDYSEFKYNLKQDRPKTVAVFLDSGISVDCVFADGQTPLRLSLKEEEYAVAKLLIERGANVSEEALKGLRIPQDIQQLIDIRGASRTSPSNRSSSQSQPERIATLKETVARMLSDMSFVRYETILGDVYHKLIQDYCNEFNEKNPLFVANFDTTTSVFSIAFAQDPIAV